MFGAIVSIVVLAGVAALHLFWAAGGSAGRSAAIPELDRRAVLRPSPAVTLAVAIVLALAAAMIALRMRLLPCAWFGPLPRIGTWALATAFALRAVGDFRYVGFFKRVRGTRFARLDTVLYSPLFCVLALLIADAARS